MAAPPYHWTPALETRFIGQLAETGSVRIAAHSVGMSPKSAYARRRRDAAFAARWREALRRVQARLTDLILEASLEGYAEHKVRNPVTGRLHWRRSDTELGRGRGLGLLNRIDRALARQLRRSGDRAHTN
jgi:hypothetical protein